MFQRLINQADFCAQKGIELVKWLSHTDTRKQKNVFMVPTLSVLGQLSHALFYGTKLLPQI